MGWPCLSFAVKGAPGENKIRELLLKTFSWQFVLDGYNIVIPHVSHGRSHDTWQVLDKSLVASISRSGLWFQTQQWKRSQAKHAKSSRVIKIHENKSRYCDSTFIKKSTLALPNCHFIMETVSSIVLPNEFNSQSIGTRCQNYFSCLLSATLIPRCSHSQTNVEKVKKASKYLQGYSSCNYILTHLEGSVNAGKSMLLYLILEWALTCFSCFVLYKHPLSERVTNCVLLSLFSTHQPHQRLWVTSVVLQHWAAAAYLSACHNWLECDL